MYNKYSKIFKTFDSDIDKISSKWGIFGKSFNDIGTAITGRISDINKGFQATNDLVGSFKNSDSILDRLYPSKETIYSEMIDINKFYSSEKLDSSFDFDGWINKLDKVDQRVKSGSLSWQEYSDSLHDNEKWIAKWGQTTEGTIRTQSDMINAYNTARESAIAYNRSLEQTTFGAKAANVAIKGLSLVANTLMSIGISVAISSVIKVVTDLIEAEKQLQSNAENLGSQLISTNNDIDQYKTKISELRDILSDSSSSFEDVTEARKNLMIIQDELIEKFGNEKVVIQDITSAIDGQTNSLDNLSKRAYVKAKNKFNNKSFAQQFKDFISFGNINDNRIASNMDKMVSQMSNSYYELSTTGNDVLDNLIAKSLNLYTVSDTYGDGKHFQIYGSLNDIQDKLYQIQELSSGFDVSTKFENNISKISSEVDKAVESYQDLYDQYVLYEKILVNSDNNQYDDMFKSISDAKEEYDKAMSSGDNDIINQATNSFAKNLTDAMNFALKNGDKDVYDYFNNMYPELKEIVSSWNFDIDFEANQDDLKTNVQNSINKLDGFSVEDINAFNKDTATQDQIDGYAELNSIATKYNMTLTTLISLLEKEGLITSENYQQMLDTFGKKNVETLSDEDLAIAYTIPNVTLLSWDELIQKIKETKNALSDETPILSFTQAISQVQELSKGFDQLDKIYADVLNKEDFDWSSILNNTSFTEVFGKTENVTEEYKAAYDDFIKTISNSPDDINKCQEAFNNLATEYVNDSGALKNLTEENKQAITTMLEQMGVSNAEEVVTATLAHNKEELTLQNILLANSTMDLSTVTADEIQRLLDEGVVTQEVAKQLAAYAAEKQYTNNKVINTEADCNNLIALMKTAEGTTEAVAKLEKLKARLYNDDGTAKVISNEERKNVERAINNIAAEFNAKVSETIKIPQMTYNGGSSTQKVRDDLSKAADSAKKTADDLYNDLKEQIDAYMDYMEKSLDAGKIDYNTYCSSVKNYLDDLYNSGKLKAKDYFDYTEKMLNKQKDIYDKVISAVVDRLEEEVDKWQGKIDELESANDKLNDNLSNMDSALDAIDRVYDNEIDRIQAIIDGLKDANDERDRTLALEKAKYELEKAYSQKVKKLYVEGKGFIYTPDYDAIKDAQSSYDDAELDVKTDELQKQIDTLTDFKSKWDDVKNAYQYNIDKMNATALLGSEYQKLILNNNILDVENFKSQYVSIQQQINSNKELIKSYNEKVDYYNKLKEQWQSITDEYDKQRNAQYASQVLGANWENDVLNGRLSTWNNFRNQYVSLQQAIADAQVQSANEQIKALQALADAAWASANEQINAAKEAQKAASGSTGSAGSVGSAYNVSGMISAGAPTSVINKITGNKSNTSAAATADQRKNNSNIIMSNEQKKTIAASKKRANNIRKYANGGVVKINPDDLLADLAKQHGEDGFVMARNGERVLTPNQNASFEKFVDLITGMNITPQMLMPDFARFATGNLTDNSSVIVNIGDINLQGVQNAEQLGDAIIKRLPGYITQKFNNKQR